MEKKNKNIFWSQNAVFGLLLGVTYILAACIFYKNGHSVSLNPEMDRMILFLTIPGLFIGVKKYQQQINQPLTYGHAFGASVYIVATAAFTYSLFVYYLYHNNPGLLENYTVRMEEALHETLPSNSDWKQFIALAKQQMTAATIAFQEIVNRTFSGTVFSLILAFLLRTPRQS